jgi:NAD-dependent dihydropyrimidine dehydrogenase PreA subunit
MIELLLQDRCTRCNACVDVCPADVFEAQTGAPPKIAVAEACHTCFLCELYCRADALYVAPDWDRRAPIEAEAALAGGTLGQYRRHSGWDEWDEAYPNEQWLMETVFRRAAEANRRRP